MEICVGCAGKGCRLRFSPAALQGVYIIEPEPFCDDRGMFSRVFCSRELDAAGLGWRISQVNRSLTRTLGAIRGIHCQRPPMAEAKIVSCLRGRVFDVVIDLRAGSPTIFQWFGTQLSGNNMLAMYVPEGFAHGFQVLEPDSEMLYFHSMPYSPQNEWGVRWDDPLVDIQWPLEPTDLSEKDRNQPFLSSGFEGMGVDTKTVNVARRNEEKNDPG